MGLRARNLAPPVEPRRGPKLPTLSRRTRDPVGCFQKGPMVLTSNPDDKKSPKARYDPKIPIFKLKAHNHEGRRNVPCLCIMLSTKVSTITLYIITIAKTAVLLDRTTIAITMITCFVTVVTGIITFVPMIITYNTGPKQGLEVP